jgi:hypothetical protein
VAGGPPAAAAGDGHRRDSRPLLPRVCDGGNLGAGGCQPLSPPGALRGGWVGGMACVRVFVFLERPASLRSIGQLIDQPTNHSNQTLQSINRLNQSINQSINHLNPINQSDQSINQSITQPPNHNLTPTQPHTHRHCRATTSLFWRPRRSATPWRRRRAGAT